MRDTMRSRIVTVIIALVALAALIGCDGGGGGGGGGKYNLYDPYYGSEGLAISYLDSAPPDVLYDGTDFKVGLLVHNKGAKDVGDAVVSVSTLDKYFAIPNNPAKSVSVKAKSFFRRSGEKKPLFLSGSVRDGSVDYDGLTVPLITTVCYSYTTHVEENLCIDPDIYNLDERQKACAVRDLVLQDQGAPVAVTRVEESIIEDDGALDVYLKAHIRNLAGGLVANAPPATLCGSGSLGEKQVDRLKVSGKLGTIPLTCGVNGIVRMDAGEADITCTARLTAKEEYTTTLTMDITYGYSSTLPQKTVTLHQTP